MQTRKGYWKNGFVGCAPLSTVLPVGKTAKKEQGQQKYPARSKLRAVATGFVRIPSLIHSLDVARRGLYTINGLIRVSRRPREFEEKFWRIF